LAAIILDPLWKGLFESMVQDTSRIDSVALDAGINELVELSRYFGSDTKFVIAGGGNTSLKTSDRLYVKGSGVALGTIDPDGFVEMKREALAALTDQDLGSIPDEREARFKEAILAARVRPEKGQRPSVECVLHNMLPRRFVVHTHSTEANMLGCSVMGEKLAAEIFGGAILWIPYVDPGFNLAKALRHALEAYNARTGLDCPPAVLMQNHGLIVCGETAAEIIQCTNWVLGRIEAYHERLPGEDVFGKAERVSGDLARSLINVYGPVLRTLLAESGRLKVVTFDDSDVALSLAGGENGRLAAIGGPLTPDQIVYCYSYPLWFEPQVDEPPEVLISRLRDGIQKHREKTGSVPLIVLVKGLGLFAVGDDFSQADAARLAYIEAIKVMSGAEKMGGIRVLPDREREFIEHWEVEAYRRGVSAAGGHKGQASGLIAIVIGAARGFASEIAQSLGEDGAHVMICDMDAEGAREHAERLSARCGKGRSKALAMDVTNDKSISDAFYVLARTYGGFDLIISNADVLRAGGVKTQPEQEFDSITAVNYKGYFLAAQKAAPILALQHAAKRDYWSDIIVINSEFGLMRSGRKGAYADAILRVIGLTQSFILELAKDGIKVNAICLGDYLDSPVWSDIETGLFVQCLGAGEGAEAKTIEDVCGFSESKVPMGRGCTKADVVKAIYYSIARKYKTES
jgi:rhamnose utilization protein RhaD (predicted bifunctional aldolase and dehydrogenase)/NAD(P)-dependent dehydrogenase (short-subunit alcohol dehydrogenase family)